MKSKRHFKKIIYITTLFLFFSASQCHADTEIENEDLVRITRVLNSLTPLINEAEQQSDPNSRVVFNYDALRSDINKIKQGIQQKWNPTLTLDPKIVKPVDGDYIDFRGKHE